MGANRKLQAEIDRTLKKVNEGIEVFDQIWEKVNYEALYMHCTQASFLLTVLLRVVMLAHGILQKSSCHITQGADSYLNPVYDTGL